MDIGYNDHIWKCIDLIWKCPYFQPTNPTFFYRCAPTFGFDRLATMGKGREGKGDVMREAGREKVV